MTISRRDQCVNVGQNLTVLAAGATFAAQAYKAIRAENVDKTEVVFKAAMSVASFWTFWAKK